MKTKKLSLLLVLLLSLFVMACERTTQEPVPAPEEEPVPAPEEQPVPAPEGQLSNCVDFGEYDNGEMFGNKFVLNGLWFTSQDSQNDGEFIINEISTAHGLQVKPDGVQIGLPTSTSLAKLEIGVYGPEEVIIQAYNYQGEEIEQMIAPADSSLHTIELSTQEMAGIMVTGGSREAVITAVCTDAEASKNDIEVWIPYLLGEPDVGDAELVVGYEPMRQAVNGELAEQLDAFGVEINTARTVRLTETDIEGQFTETVAIAPIGPSQCLNFRDQAEGEQLENLKREGFELQSRNKRPLLIYQTEETNGLGTQVPEEGIDIFLPEETSKVSLGIVTYHPEPLLIVAFDRNGQPVSRVEAPTEPQGTLHSVVLMGEGISLIRIEGGGGEGVLVELCVANAITENPELLQQQLQADGIILGTLLLETDVPDTLLPSGAYIERAQLLDDTQGKVELINSTGKIMFEVSMQAEKIEQLIEVPTASIFLGSKRCYTCVLGYFCACRECYFFQTPDPICN